MMKKILSVFVTLSMVLTILAVGAWPKTTLGAPKPTKQFKQTLPSYAQLNKDLLMDAKERGQTLKGKTLYGINGKAYFKPVNSGSLLPIDGTGKNKLGIAILVDFKDSVPGVNFDPVPAGLFNDLLNNTTYKPYDYSLFTWIKTAALAKGITPPIDRTLNNYYKEVSNDQFKITVDVKGWYTLKENYEYYLGQNKTYYNENGDAHIGELIKEAIALAKADGVDFSKYAIPAKAGDFEDLYKNATSFKDENGNIVNQIVPNVFIIHRGTGAEYSGDPQLIWSHKWDILSASYYGEYYKTGVYPSDDSLKYTIVDGVVINTYNICPEVGQDLTEYYTGPAGIAKRAPSPADPGVFAHEFGHVLGLPDQYDYGYESEGTGMFTLMASGSYGREVNTDDKNLNRYFSGFSPVHMDAWSKYYLSFATPTVIVPTAEKQTITLNSSVTLDPSIINQNIYRINVPDSNGKEYFLLENRQQTGYDKGLAYNVDGDKLHGLVVYHVDENVLMRNFHRPNEAANWDWNNRGKNYKDAETGENHYGIAVVQADGRWDMEKGNNDGDAGDTFPGNSSVILLSPDIKATPNTVSYYRWGTDSRNYTGIAIDNIVENNGVITAQIYLAK